MSTSAKGECPRCGAVLQTTGTEGLCPACLLSGALEPRSGPAETVSVSPGESLSRYGPSEFPCEFGGYRLLGRLGRGGMGLVYEALQHATGRRVALKMLGQQLDAPDLRQRFLREGRLAAGVNHPNSLYIFGSEEIEGLPVITMEIADRGTLQDRLDQHGPLPVREAVDAVLDVIAGLEAACAGGVLHRDIKPSNCFVGPDGSVKVGDFGLSVSTLVKTDTFVTAPNQIMGTPAYAAPEQLRGDALDLRADIYAVGATLFALLTSHPPFEGDNAVQVVANAVHQEPKSLIELRDDVPAGLARVVARCLAKEPEKRYPDYPTLRNALLPFSSREAEPASIKVRASAGWIDYLIAFLIPYVALMLLVGAEPLLIQPLVERTLYSSRYYLALFGCGFLYFGIAEGIGGAGLGKRLKGLRVVRTNGRVPGVGRALIRILIPIASVEGVRMPLMLATISGADWTGSQTALFVGAAMICGWIPVLLMLRARRENGFATVWDLASGTRVVVKPQGAVRPSLEPAAEPETAVAGGRSLGPYHLVQEIAPGRWIVATDPVLRRPVWLLRRNAPELCPARRNLARPGRLRWLQKVETAGAIWDAFEATPGVPFSRLVESGNRVPWSTLRHWLHDLTSELWDAAGDGTLPATLSLDQIWITARGRAVLLDEPWPRVKSRAEPISVRNVAGQQRFLNTMAACVESTSVPLHARGVLRNLEQGKFERLSFLAGTLRGLLDRPAEVSQGIRAGSIFVLPLFVWILVFLGYYQAERIQQWNDSLGAILLISALAVLAVTALIQLLELPVGSTASHAIFRLAVVNAAGEPAERSRLLARWAIVWVPLFLPLLVVALVTDGIGPTAALLSALVLLLLWIGAALHAAVHPHRGWHDRLAGTWVVRQ
jgi:uncharacterized RDD family membrane protein YckC